MDHGGIIFHQDLQTLCLKLYPQLFLMIILVSLVDFLFFCFNFSVFLVVQFEEYVYPEQLCIFETYNPGAVVQVYAYTINEEWILLWQEKSKKTPKTTRLFSPNIKKIWDPTRIIRLDFNHTYLHYFTEIDAIMLTGYKYIAPVSVLNQQLSGNGVVGKRRRDRRGPIQRKLESVQFKPMKVQNHASVLKDFLVNEFENFIIESGMLPTNNTEIDSTVDRSILLPITLQDLPVNKMEYTYILP